MFLYLLKASGPSALVPTQNVTIVCRRAFQTKEEAHEHEPTFRASCLAPKDITTAVNHLGAIDTLDIFPIHMRDDIAGVVPHTIKKVNPITEIAYKVSKIFKRMDELDKANPGVISAHREKYQMYDVSALLYSIGNGDFKAAQKWLDSLAKIR